MSDTWLTFTAENSNEIPHNLQDYTFIERLIIIDCGLSELPNGLENCHNLFSVDLPDNQLHNIPEGVFTNENMPRLISIDLENNQLTSLPIDLLKLNQLEYLNINNNPIKNFNTCVKLPKLKDWFVEDIEVTELPEEIYLPEIESFEWRGYIENRILPKGFNLCHKLKAIRIYKSELSDISILSCLPVLNEITITFSKLKEVFELPISLKKLDLSFNKIKKITPYIDKLHLLEALNLSNNLLEEIPTELGKLSQLHYLNLNNNQLKEIPISLNHLTQLEHLTILNNPIRFFKINFDNLKKLQTIDLCIEEDTKVDDSLFQCSALKRLNITGGKIQENTIWNLPNLNNCELKDCLVDVFYQNSKQVSEKKKLLVKKYAEQNELSFTNSLALPTLEKLVLSNIKTPKKELNLHSLNTLKYLYLYDIDLHLSDLPDSLISFVYLNKIAVSHSFKLPPKLYLITSLEKIVIQQNLLEPQEWEKLVKHCQEKNIDLQVYYNNDGERR